MLGFRHSAETRLKMSMAHRGRILTPEHQTKITAALRERTISEEHRAKISAANRGKTKSPEHRAKLSAANLGKKCSAETIARMREAHRGKKHSDESRAKIGLANRGKIRSPEHQTKLGDAHRGKTLSTEHRAKISKANLGRACTAETRAKIGAAHLGRSHTAEARAKISAAMSNPSDETRAKRRAANLGKTLSIEHRAKIGAAMLGNTHLRGKKASPESRIRYSAAASNRTTAWKGQKKMSGPERYFFDRVDPAKFQYIGCFPADGSNDANKIHKVRGFTADFVCRDQRLLIWIDGCYTHVCPLHYPHAPEVERRATTDARQVTRAQAEGWQTLRIWEHELSTYPFKKLMDLASETPPNHIDWREKLRSVVVVA